MSYPWMGAARPMDPSAFSRAAKAIGCDEAAIRAVWQVEAGGRAFLSDNSVIRRYEPHHFPGTGYDWRASLKVSSRDREAMFLKAFKKDPEAACKATSWGSPQIMGFNHKAAGFNSAVTMVEAMAKDETAHLEAFTELIRDWGLDSAMRAKDWCAFAKRYNGSGQPSVYAAKIEKAYRNSTGTRTAEVLRVGDRGAAVRRLQAALGIADDGAFGPGTLAAVRAFQEAHGLAVDGIVGAATWAALKGSLSAEPKPKPFNFILLLVDFLLRLVAAKEGD